MNTTGNHTSKEQRLVFRARHVWTPETVNRYGLVIKTLLLRNPQRKNVFNIYNEIAFNIMLHSDLRTRQNHVSTKDFGEGTLELWESSNSYIFHSINEIHSENKLRQLVERCQHINALDNDGLKEFYKITRIDSSKTERESGNLGLIDIVRRSKNKIDYNYTKLKNLYEVTLKAQIDK